jgi:hypothetical protein
MADTKTVAQSILQDTVHRGMIAIPKEDAVKMARGYLEWVRIKDAMQTAVDKNAIPYAGYCVADNVDAVLMKYAK